MLRELQQEFMRGVIDGHAVAGIKPAAALSVYENNVRVNFTQTLQRTYPVIWRLVGEDYFRQCARDYHKRYPSRSGDLQYVGGGFGDYLSNLHGADEFSYLADVALLEWAYQESLHERLLRPLDVGRLAALEPHQYADLRFSLQPSARVVDSRFPVLAIWRANTDASDDGSVQLCVDLKAGADRLLLVRTGAEVSMHRLSIGEATLLRSLKARDTLASALEAAGDLDPEFDPSASLQKWVALGLTVDFHFQETLNEHS